MRVLLVPADSAACGTYRIIYPAAACLLAGYDITVESSAATNAIGRRSRDGRREIAMADPVDADVVVIQRPATSSALATIEYLKRRGHRVVVEFDDDLETIAQTNKAYAAYQQLEMNARWARECVDAADAVVVSTPALARRYRTDTIVENRVPDAYLQLGRKALERRADDSDFGRRVGWTGSLSVHRGDLAVVGTGIRDAIARSTWEFFVVGRGEGVGRELCMREDPDDTGWLPLDQYIEQVVKLGIGIAPLADTAFNASKSWLKSLEYASFGVPHVCSASDEYQRLGAGLIARKPKMWRGILGALLDSAEARFETAVEGMKIAEQWCYEGSADVWWSAWTGIPIEEASPSHPPVVRSSA